MEYAPRVGAGVRMMVLVDISCDISSDSRFALYHWYHWYQNVTLRNVNRKEKLTMYVLMYRKLGMDGLGWFGLVWFGARGGWCGDWFGLVYAVGY